MQPVEHVGDHVGDVAELGFAEAARGAGGRADADPAGLDRRQRVERHAVLVAGDPGALEALVGILAGEPEGTEVDEREVRVCAARNEIGAALLEASASVFALAMTAFA